jgi:integrase
MGRTAQGWKLRRDDTSGLYYVRFRLGKSRPEYATGSRDPGRAAEQAARIYADAVAGRLKPRVTTARSSTLAAVVFAEWLASIETTHAETTRATWKTYVDAHYLDAFETLGDVTSARLSEYMRRRLGEVLAVTVRKELSALRSFVTWASEQGYVGDVVVPAIPKKSIGTRATTRKESATEVDAGDVADLLERLPVWSSSSHPKRFPVRAYFRVLWETALRPSTIQRLTVEANYHRGDTELRITAGTDKNRYVRRLPLTDAARAALDEVAPSSGTLFGRHDWRGFLPRAGAAAGLLHRIASGLSPYDLRHGRLTQLAEQGNLPGLAYIAGWTQVTTANVYARPNARAAKRLLEHVSGGVSGGASDGLAKTAVRRGGLEPPRSYPLAPQESETRRTPLKLAKTRPQITAGNRGTSEASGGVPPKELVELRDGVKRLRDGWGALEDTLARMGS